MNVTTFPMMLAPVKQDGQFRDEYTNFFSLNTQEQARYFSNDGHLVPTRTNLDLVGDGKSDTGLSTTQYTARFSYNGTTNNHMANTAGQYKNITMNTLSTRAAIVGMTPMANTIEFFSDENKNLYTNVNGTIYQNLTVPLTFPVNFTTDGTNLSVNISGTTSDVVLSDPSIPMKFTAFDGTNLTVTINGVPRTIVTS